MKWSFSIAKIGGTQVRIHATFFLLLAFFGFYYYQQGGVETAFVGVTFICVLFFCVLLHEFGHVLAARRYGIHTPDITLLPIGGMARMERMPKRPLHELVVALAGPLVNVVIAVVLWIVLGGVAAFEPFMVDQGEGVEAEVFMISWAVLPHAILFANIILAVFNMVPAFPMDGGRVLRAMLASFMPYTQATRYAATIGQGIALVGGFYALLNGLFLLALIAMFIFFMAGQEASSVSLQEVTDRFPVVAGMLGTYRFLTPNANLREAIAMLLAGSQQDFPIQDSAGNLHALLTRNDLISGLRQYGEDYPVIEVATRKVPRLYTDMMLTEAMGVMRAAGLQSLPVLDHDSGLVVGLLTADNIGEMVIIEEALRGRR